MTTATKQKKKPSGGAALVAAGRSPLMLGLYPDDKRKIRMAAASEGLPMSQFLIKYGLMAAEKLLAKS